MSNLEMFNLEKHWDKFLEGKLVVNCPTEGLAKQFLNICQEQNLRWGSGDEPSSQTNFSEYGNETTYRRTEHSNRGLNYASLGFYLRDYDAVVFQGLSPKKVPPTETTKEDIEVIYHGRETVVLLKSDGKCFKGVSRCYPEDDYDQLEGVKLAYVRAKEKQLNPNKVEEKNKTGEKKIELTEELTEMEKTILFCTFDVVNCNNCPIEEICDANGFDRDEEGKKILIKLGITTKEELDKLQRNYY